MVDAQRSTRVDATLVTGGKYHDFDFARLELLRLLAEHEEIRVRVQPDYEDTDAITSGSMLVSYTCDVRPSTAAQQAICSWVRSGARWLALHGTNAALDLDAPTGVDAPNVFPLWTEMLGSRFVAHPPIQPYTVEVSAPEHWLVRGLSSFETDDELYLSEYADRAALEPLLHTVWKGEARGFVQTDWGTADPHHLVMYLRELGHGSILYNTLGHCRGHFDMTPRLAYYPRVERGSWTIPTYYELLRRSLRWAKGQTT